MRSGHLMHLDRQAHQAALVKDVSLFAPFERFADQVGQRQTVALLQLERVLRHHDPPPLVFPSRRPPPPPRRAASTFLPGGASPGPPPPVKGLPSAFGRRLHLTTPHVP